jgi:uncharacterized repeat protein (TIGR03803 family)
MKVRFLRRLYRIVFPLALTLLLVSNAVGAATKKLLHVFLDKPAANPVSNLIFDAQGNLYGSTGSSGHQTCKCGTVFRLSPQADGGWEYQVLYQFRGDGDGGYPAGNLVFDDAGNLYGASQWGYGSVFRLTQQTDGSWTESTVYTFTGTPDGSIPTGGLIIDGVGNLYGTTGAGGRYGEGTVYKLTPTKGGTWSEAILYSFSGADGLEPNAGVTRDQSGNLYGTTVNGGQYGRGVVFKLTRATDSWTETVLHSFKGGTDPGEPFAGVTVDSSGNVYGTTTNNDFGGSGTVFRLKPNADGSWTETILHVFGEREGDGDFPSSNLVPDAAGNLYGTTYVGGANGEGIIYKLTQPSEGHWKETVFHSFNYADGANPADNPVTFDASGNIFVATAGGGLHEGYDGYGVVLEIAP